MRYRSLVFLFLIPLILYGDLTELNHRVSWELDHIGYPEDWAKEKEGFFQVAIIGSGMAGIAAAYGLYRVGIHHIAIFDENEKNQEGPWLTYAKMKILRTSKEATGPSLFTPSLTFQAWYEAIYGLEAWNYLDKPLTKDWGHYLNWLKNTLKLPVINDSKLQEILPLKEGGFKLIFDQNEVYAQKIILATGRKGCGGYEIPQFMKDLPQDFYLHTEQIKDYSYFKGKRIAIIGSGTSAYDAAAEALESSAISVDMFSRRIDLPLVNKFDILAHVGMEEGFYELPDTWKFNIIDYALRYGTPPPDEAIKRLNNLSGLRILKGVEITSEILKENYDFIILATGYRIDVSSVSELKHFSSHIKLWKDFIGESSSTGAFPYLGSHFQFIGEAPFLKHVYCFNYGALVSHGLISSSIDAITAGALRLTQGIAADFFAEEIETFYDSLKNQF